MAKPNERIAIWIDEHQVGLAQIRCGSKPVVVKSVEVRVDEHRATWLDDESVASEVGRQLKLAAKAAGIPTSKASHAIGVIARRCVVVKRLNFAGSPDVERELPGMVRLQLVRQLALSLDDAKIDYVVIEPFDARAEAAGTTVLATALIGHRARAIQSMFRSLGTSPKRISVSPNGLAALVASRLAQRETPTLLMYVHGSTADFIMVQHGMPTYARTIELDPVADDDEHGHMQTLLASEAKRTWVSERLDVPGEPAGECFVVVDEPFDMESGKRLAQLCSEELRLPTTADVASAYFAVEANGRVEAGGGGWLAAAAGSAHAMSLGLDTLNLLRVRKIPDPHAKARQLAMAAGFLIVAGAGVGYTILSGELRELEARRDVLAERQASLSQQLSPAMRTQIQRDYLQRWESTQVDWLAHVDTITAALPDRDEFVLEQLSLSSEPVVSYEPPRGRRSVYDWQHWQQRTPLNGTLIGQGASVEVGARVRQTFVESEIYRAQPVGRDLPASGDDRFPVDVSLRLDSTRQDAGSDTTASDEEESS